VARTSMTGPPRSELLELDSTARVGVNRAERGTQLSVGEARAQLVEQSSHLDLVDPTVAVRIDTLEAVSQGIVAHAPRLRRRAARSKTALVAGLLAVLGACRSREPAPRALAIAPEPPAATIEAHPVVAAGHSSSPATLPPLPGEWLERVGAGATEVVLMPPLGSVEPSRLVIGVHGAGDRPDWACGGWRLGSRVSAIVACPRGSKLGSSTFAWSSASAIEAGVEHALEVARARFGRYLDDGPLVFAGFSQGATLAEPLLRRQAARFPIAILAEGGYQTAQSPAFAKSYRAGGGRRVVLVCGTPSCFRSAARAKLVLEQAGLEVLVVGDPKAGHNLNQELQRALQASWARIVASPAEPVDGAPPTRQRAASSPAQN
jgi:predicted esterase